jgi:transposase InsO family protein
LSTFSEVFLCYIDIWFLTDNGREFCGNEFEELCKTCGITRQKTTPYTPQQNGVAERMNMTLMEKARCMLSGVGLGK